MLLLALLTLTLRRAKVVTRSGSSRGRCPGRRGLRSGVGVSLEATAKVVFVKHGRINVVGAAVSVAHLVIVVVAAQAAVVISVVVIVVGLLLVIGARVRVRLGIGMKRVDFALLNVHDVVEHRRQLRVTDGTITCSIEAAIEDIAHPGASRSVKRLLVRARERAEGPWCVGVVTQAEQCRAQAVEHRSGARLPPKVRGTDDAEVVMGKGAVESCNEEEKNLAGACLIQAAERASQRLIEIIGWRHGGRLHVLRLERFEQALLLAHRLARVRFELRKDLALGRLKGERLGQPVKHRIVEELHIELTQLYGERQVVLLEHRTKNSRVRIGERRYAKRGGEEEETWAYRRVDSRRLAQHSRDWWVGGSKHAWLACSVVAGNGRGGER